MTSTFCDFDSLQIYEANLLFIDSPVGTGFSYVDNNMTLPDVLAGTDEEIGRDLVYFMQQFYEKHPDFKVEFCFLLKCF